MITKFKEWLFKKLWPSVTVDRTFLIVLCEIEEVFYSVPQPSMITEKFEEAISLFSDHMGKHMQDAKLVANMNGWFCD